MRVFLRLLLAVCVLSATPAWSQTFNMEQDRVQMATLKGMWRFHIGDDPAWSNPSFDDSHWALLQSDKPWSQQGYSGYGGMAWYRFSVVLPSQHGPLGIYLPAINTSYQVFANGSSLALRLRCRFSMNQEFRNVLAILSTNGPLRFEY